jgi:uncharacterized membrane protein YeaQ/YmgE (transglycosylase-associated protein family)
MGLLLWIAFGAVAGSMARWVMPGPSAGGLAIAIPLGIAGALVGGGIGLVIGSSTASIDFRALLLAMIGSLAVLLCYRSFALRTES